MKERLSSRFPFLLICIALTTGDSVAQAEDTGSPSAKAQSAEAEKAAPSYHPSVPEPTLREVSYGEHERKNMTVAKLAQSFGRHGELPKVLATSATDLSAARLTSPKGAKNFPALKSVVEIPGPWKVSFDPKWGGPESVVFERLDDWTKRPEEGIRHYSGTATYRQTFDLSETSRCENAQIYLDLGRVQNLATVRLNGNDLGVVWTPPWRVEITDAVKPTGNRLEIDVVNLWPNRLIGDAALPPEKRLTKTNVTTYKKDSPLLESGLLGPVTLQEVTP